MSTADTRVVTADDGTRIVAHVSGPDDADRTVILAHGWTLSSAAWRPVIAQLCRIAPGLRVVAYDQRHHGESGRSDTPLSIDVLGTDLAAVVRQLAPYGRLLLGGHSMGGMTVMALAAAHPDLIAQRVDGVALVGTSAGGHAADPLLRLLSGPLGETLRRYAPVLDRARRLAPPAVPAHQHLARRLLFGPLAATEVVRAGAELVHACPLRTLLEFVPALRDHDKRDQLAPLSAVPVHVLVGDRDRLTPPRRARFLAEHIAGARLTVLPRYGHMLTLERPETVARAIADLAVRQEGERHAPLTA